MNRRRNAVPVCDRDIRSRRRLNCGDIDVLRSSDRRVKREERRHKRTVFVGAFRPLRINSERLHLQIKVLRGEKLVLQAIEPDFRDEDPTRGERLLGQRCVDLAVSDLCVVQNLRSVRLLNAS